MDNFNKKYSANGLQQLAAKGEEGVTPDGKLIISQETPIRVLHRRSNMIRPKELLWLKIDRINDHYMELRLHTSAGMYIKEFCHGDFGRTRPNLATLLGSGKCDILQLDVEDVVD